MVVLTWLTCAALAGFAGGCLYKAFHYATLPMHVRWELYPVAHERGKVAYGGSYFEELDWWTKPREVSRIGEVKTIAVEVLTLKAVREHNPKLWLQSLLFHYGLYLLFALGFALLAGALARVLELPGVGFLAGGRLLSAWGATGLALATLGCGGLLVRRLANPQLRNASTPADFLHLWLLLAVFAASWGSWLGSDRAYAAAAAFAEGLVTLRAAPVPSGWFAAQVVLLGVFLAYLPWSHMTHMFAKYFTWHSVRWDDAPNLGGTVYQARVEKLLALPISWSAPHIGGGGGKRWADVVSERGETPR